MFSCEFSKISKNTFFKEHLWTTASVFSLSEAATGGVLWKRCSWKSRKSQEKHLWFAKFSRTPFLQNTSATTTLLKSGTANGVWKTLDEYSLSRNSNLQSTVQVYHFFLFLIKLQTWHLFWRTSAKDCFCTAHTPLTVTYPFYFIFSTFFLIITVTTQKQSSGCVL